MLYHCPNYRNIPGVAPQQIEWYALYEGFLEMWNPCVSFELLGRMDLRNSIWT